MGPSEFKSYPRSIQNQAKILHKKIKSPKSSNKTAKSIKSHQNLAKIKQIHPSYHPKIHPSYVSPRRRCLRPRRDHKAGVRADRGTGDGAAVTHLAKELRKKWGRWPWGHGEIHGKSRFGKYVWNPSIWVVLFNLFGERFDFKRGNEWARLAVQKNACHIFLAISIPDGLRRFIVQKSTTIFNFWLYAIEFTNAPRFMEFDSAEKNRLIFSTPQKSSWAAPRLTVMGSRISTWFRHRSYSLFQQLGNGG